MDPLFEAGVALVTGAASGIGQQIALQFVQRGCQKIFLADLTEDKLQQTSQLLKEAAPTAVVVLHAANMSEDVQVKEMVDKCIEVFGRLDFACNNAGIAMSNVKTADVDLELFEKVHNVNSRGVFLCMRYEIEAMLKQEPLPVVKGRRASRGSIVNTASMAGLGVVGTLAPYNSSKHAVVSMTRVDARQYAKDKIRVNCICPGFVDTPMLNGSGLSEEYLKSAMEQSPMNRLVDAEEVAEGAMFLSGSGGSAVTGISLLLDAGAFLYHII